jgi:hypothetical protein
MRLNIDVLYIIKLGGEENEKKPIGIQTFKDIIEKDYFYM